ncbi:MAG: hypothetical protein CFE43_21500 [Burkholderiales bacterium PBB3]|nr:MAG: hypothetical protein CFE43_21500 [Burkholderiales bacterium PBB3]
MAGVGMGFFYSLVMSHDDGLDEVSAVLTEAGVKHTLFHDCIHVAISNIAGIVELRSPIGHSRTATYSGNGGWSDLEESEGEFDSGPHEVVRLLLNRMQARGLQPALVDRKGEA